MTDTTFKVPGSGSLDSQRRVSLSLPGGKQYEACALASSFCPAL